MACVWLCTVVTVLLCLWGTLTNGLQNPHTENPGGFMWGTPDTLVCWMFIPDAYADQLTLQWTRGATDAVVVTGVYSVETSSVVGRKRAQNALTIMMESRDNGRNFTCTASLSGESSQARILVTMNAGNSECLCTSCNRTPTAFVNGSLYNAAYSKPTTSSSVVGSRKRSAKKAFKACNINDGRLDSVYVSGVGDSAAWLDIDLERIITFDNVVVFRELGNSADVSWQRMAALNILVDGRRCYGFPGSKQLKELPQKLQLTCLAAMTGRHVRLAKRVNESAYANKHIIGVAEILIWVCLPGMFGNVDTGCKPCPEECEYPCNNYYGCADVTYNVGLGKPASRQPVTNGSEGGPEFLNDGVPPYDTTTCMTLSSDAPGTTLWWRVDLQETHSVSAVTVTLRHFGWVCLPVGGAEVDDGCNKDCPISCVYPCNNFSGCWGGKHLGSSIEVRSVVVTSVDKLPTAPTGDQLCSDAVSTAVIDPYWRAEVPCRKKLIGRYVWVTGSPQLRLCEVEVFGRRSYQVGYGEPCNTATVCGSDAVCNTRPGSSSKKCRRPLGGQCSQDEDCARNSICGKMKHCKLNYGEACSTTKDCRSDAVCGKRPGSTAKKCRQPLKSQCSQNEDCEKNAICDKMKQCSLDIHRSCQNDTTACRIGTVCDVLKVCKRLAGKKCREDKECMAGAHCNNSLVCLCTENITVLQGNSCVPVPSLVGGSCGNESCSSGSKGFCDAESQTCLCVEGFAGDPANLTCRKALGRGCTDDLECITGHLCDPAKRECRIQLGYFCLEPYKEFCATGTLCDSDFVCRLGVGQKCDANDADQPCRIGALCVDSICECDRNSSLANSIACKSKIKVSKSTEAGGIFFAGTMVGIVIGVAAVVALLGFTVSSTLKNKRKEQKIRRANAALGLEPGRGHFRSTVVESSHEAKRSNLPEIMPLASLKVPFDTMSVASSESASDIQSLASFASEATISVTSSTGATVGSASEVSTSEKTLETSKGQSE